MQEGRQHLNSKHRLVFLSVNISIVTEVHTMLCKIQGSVFRIVIININIHPLPSKNSIVFQTFTIHPGSYKQSNPHERYEDEDKLKEVDPNR